MCVCVCYHQAGDNDDKDSEEEQQGIKAFSAPHLVIWLPLEDVFLYRQCWVTCSHLPVLIGYQSLQESSASTHTHLSGNLCDAKVSQVVVKDPDVQ